MSEAEKGRSLCSFSAHVRRPKPLQTGMVAQFFAPNGPDADAVCMLGRSALQDALVEVCLFDGDEPCEGFRGYLRRPQPLQAGMVAQFFGENGRDADLIAALSLSRFFDQLLRLDIALLKMPDGSAAAKPKGPYAEFARKLWLSPFLARPDVQAVVVSVAGAGAPAISQAADARERKRWCWRQLAHELGCESMTEVEPKKLAAWAAQNGVEKALPADVVA